MFQFSDIDTKIDQPQAQIILDHDKISARGLKHAADRQQYATEPA